MFTQHYRKIKNDFEAKAPKIYLILKRNRLIIKYILSGIFATSVDLTALYILNEHVFSFDLYVLSVSLAFILAFFSSFFLQKFWTFGDRKLDHVGGQLAVYISIAILNLGLNLFIVIILVEFFYLWYLWAQIISGAFLAGLSFILYNRFVFRNSLMVRGSIMLASGIFPPDIGGPSIHSEHFLRGFSEKGIKTGVVTYSDVGKFNEIDNEYDIERVSRRIPFGVRHLVYFLRLMIASLKYEIIYAQDISATGIPAMLVSKFIKRRFFIRIGGDILWERLAEKGRTNLSAVVFYDKGFYFKYILYHIGVSVLSRAEKIIVPTQLLADIYRVHYGIPEEKIMVIKNPIKIEIPKYSDIKNSTDSNIVFAGRFVKYKNLDKLIKVFSEIYEEIRPAKLILIGDGPEKKRLEIITKELGMENNVLFKSKMSQELLRREIDSSYMCVGPASTEFNPNFILECLSFGRPILITKENGLSVKLPDKFLIDISNEVDLKEKIKSVMRLRGSFPGELSRAIKDSNNMTWDDIIRMHIKLFKKII